MAIKWLDRGMLRTRWAAIGAAVAVCVGAGGLQLASASDPSPSPVLTTISPCRLLDTRPATTVGPRNTPIGSGQTLTTPVRGTNGGCTIPAGAVGVVLNVTIAEPSAGSFLTVFPTGSTRPTASNLNWTAGQAPTPNQVTAALGTGGQLSFFNNFGTVHVLVDITGYLTDHHHDDRYPTDAEVSALIDAAIDEAGGGADEHGTTHVIVPADGTPVENGAALRAALDAITDATAQHPYLVELEPGTYDVDGILTTAPFVTVAGDGREATTVLARASSDDEDFGVDAAGVVVVGDSGLRDLTVRSVPASTDQVAIAVLAVGPGDVLLDRIEAHAAPGPATNSSWGVVARGGVALEVRDSIARASAGSSANALTAIDGNFVVRGSDLIADGNAPSRIAAYTIPLDTRLEIHGSRLVGTVAAWGNGDLFVSGSMLSGTSTGATCIASFDADFAPLDANCEPVP